MPPILIQAPDKGIDCRVPVNQLDGRSAAAGSQNLIYENGLFKTAFGFAKMDLTAGLSGGSPVIHIFPYKEIDGYGHDIAVTTDDIFDHDRVNDTWNSILQAGKTFQSNLDTPVSYVAIGHNDTTLPVYFNESGTGTQAYFHLIICNGGNSDIQRWTGRHETDTADLLCTASDYHDGTTHRAKHVGRCRNRLILLSPKLYSSTTLKWTEYNQRIEWPEIGQIQGWDETATGAGYVNLQETGGYNIWAAGLAGDYIIYQNQGIWSINYIGGETVFSPYPLVTDLGLLSPHLLVAQDNVHYFVANNYNVYAFYGGTTTVRIGDPIHEYLLDDLETHYQHRCWMTLDAEGKRLWIFIVPEGGEYITKAYGMDIRSGKWMVRDFSHIWNASTSGITAVNLLAADQYDVGETYQELLDTISTYEFEDEAPIPIRYGDFLQDASVTLTTDISTATWKAGGLDCSENARAFSADFTENDILLITDGSLGTNVHWGDHFYTVYDVSTNGFSIRPRHSGECAKLDYTNSDSKTYAIQIGDTIDGTTSASSAFIANLDMSAGSWAGGDAVGSFFLIEQDGTLIDGEWLNVGTETHVAKVGNYYVDDTQYPTGGGDLGCVSGDGTTDIPSNICSKAGHGLADAVFFSACADSDPGEKYDEAVEEVLTDDRLAIGDSDGYIYQFAEDVTADNDINIPAIHYTPVFDLGEPDLYKRWPGISLIAKGDAVQIEYCIDDEDWRPVVG